MTENLRRKHGRTRLPLSSMARSQTARDDPAPFQRTSRLVSWPLKLCIMATSLLVALVLAELVIRWTVPVRNVGPAFTTYDPVYRRRNKKNASFWTKSPEFQFRFSTNSYGFRGPEAASLPRHVILFLGDSFTQGYGVDDGREFASLVGDRLREHFGSSAMPVINAGMGNTGNGHWVKFLKREAAQFQPRFVVLQLCRNDFGDNIREKLFKIDSSGQLEELPVPGPDWTRRVQFLIESVPGLHYSHLVGLTKQAVLQIVRTKEAQRIKKSHHREADGDRSPSRHSDPAELTYELVRESLKICRRANWPALVIGVGLPEYVVRRLHELSRDFNTAVVNFPSKEERPDLYFQVDGHWNPAGHEFVANRVFGHILQHTSTHAAANLLQETSQNAISAHSSSRDGIK